MKVIALTGKARSGKDTAAEFLVERYGYRKYAFADALKQAVKIVFGIPNDVFLLDQKTWKHPDFPGETYRSLLQKFSEHTKLLFGKDIWIDAVRRKILQDCEVSGVSPEYVKVVISDCRFPAEAEWIRKEFGLILCVEREIEKVTNLRPEEQAHVSEINLAPEYVYATVRNDAALTDLYDRIEAAIGHNLN